MKKIRGTKGGAIIPRSSERDAMLDAMVAATMQRIADGTYLPEPLADDGERMRIKNAKPIPDWRDIKPTKRAFGTYSWTELKIKK